MNKNSDIIPPERIENTIYIIRGQRVIIDQDLAMLYGVSTKRMNEQIRRNHERFPEDFAFQLDEKEWLNLRSQFATSNTNRGGRRYLPYVFTEHGVVMAANVLKSKKAISISIKIVRAFIKLRHTIANIKAVNDELSELKSFLLKNSHATDREFRRVWQAIEKLSEIPEQRKIGFKLD